MTHSVPEVYSAAGFVSQFVGIACGTVFSWDYAFLIGFIKGVPLPWKWDTLWVAVQTTSENRADSFCKRHQMPEFLALNFPSFLDELRQSGAEAEHGEDPNERN